MTVFELAIRPDDGLGTAETGNVRLVMLDRPNRACCGCCECFGDMCRQEEWRDLNGHRRGCGNVLGGIVFGLAIGSIVLMVLLVWSLDSFGDDVADSGSGFGV